MTFFLLADWLVVVCQILSLVFGYLRYKQLRGVQAIKNLKTSIAGSSTSGSNSFMRTDCDESSSDDDDFEGGYFDPPIKLGGKSRGFIIKKNRVSDSQDLARSGSVSESTAWRQNDLQTGSVRAASISESTTWNQHNKDLDDEPARTYSEND
jgi:hypothetical protein